MCLGWLIALQYAQCPFVVLWFANDQTEIEDTQEERHAHNAVVDDEGGLRLQ